MEIPEDIPTEYRAGKIPKRVERQLIAQSSIRIRSTCEQIGRLFRPMPSASDPIERTFEYGGDLLSWLGTRAESEPHAAGQGIETWSTNVPCSVKQFAREYARSRYDVLFTPSSYELVIACGFVVGELIRLACPSTHWIVVAEPNMLPVNRLALGGFRTSLHFDPRCNFHTCAWQVICKHEADPHVSMKDMMGALMDQI